MFLGKVIGQVWATRKSADLEGKRLLVVQALDERRDPAAPKVTPVVAADSPGLPNRCAGSPGGRDRCLRDPASAR